MEIDFRTKKMTKIANSERKLKKAYGELSDKIQRRLQMLRAANTLAIYEQLDPLSGLHQLTGNRKEQFAVDLSGNFRLTFKVANEPIPRMENSEGIDRSRVTHIKVLELSEDYHG